MKKTRIIVVLLLSVCCLTGCVSESGTSNVSQTSKNDTENAAAQSAEEEEQHVYLPENFFNNYNYKAQDEETTWENFITNFCLSSYYDCPEDVNLSSLFGYGFGLQITEEDINFFDEQGGDATMDIAKIPGEKMEEVLQQYFDISLEGTNKVGLNMRCYKENADIYYIYEEIWDEIYVNKQYLDEDGNIVIEYAKGKEKYATKGIAVLKLKGNRFVFLSNKKVD